VNSGERKDHIDRLTNQQSLTIARLMTDFLESKAPEGSLPEEENEQKRALSEILTQYGHDVDLTKSDLGKNVNEETVGAASKQLLLFIAESQDEELLNKLDGYLNSPPTGGVAAIDPALLPIFLPIVFAGCIALLNVVGGISYENGRWKFNARQKSGEPDPVERNLRSFRSLLAPIFGRKSTKPKQ
jgi:hypothetical protein